MQVTSIVECSMGHSAKLLTFIKLLLVIKIFVLSILGCLLKTGFVLYTVPICLVFPSSLNRNDETSSSFLPNIMHDP